MGFLDDEVEFTYRLVTASAIETLCSTYFGRGEDVSHKSDQSPVTIADKAINEFLIDNLSKKFPRDGFISEELEDRQGSERIWFIDPIDGTKSFISGTYDFAVQIGLAINGSPVMGIIYNPLSKILHIGKHQNINPTTDSTINPSNVQEGIGAIMRIGISPNDLEHPKRKDFLQKFNSAQLVTSTGGEGLRLMGIVGGEYDARRMTSTYGPWDLCAPHAILLKAGGVILDSNGKDIQYLSRELVPSPYFAASNRRLALHMIDIHHSLR